MNPDVPQPPIMKEFLLRIPKEAITINNGKIFFNENYMGQCCGAWVSVFFMALDALSRTFITSYAVNNVGSTYTICDFDPKQKLKRLAKGYTMVDAQAMMTFKHRDEESGISYSIPRFSVFLETCVGDPGITTNDVLMWVLIYDKAFIIEEFILEYISSLKQRISEESVDLKEMNTPNKVRKNKKAIQYNDGGDICRLLANFNIYCDGCKFLSAAKTINSHASLITIDSENSPFRMFNPANILARLTCWNRCNAGEYHGFYHRSVKMKDYQQHFGYDFINNYAKFNSLCLPYVVPMEVYRNLVFNIIKREFPTRDIIMTDIPEIVSFKYVYETDIDPFFYVHCYFLMWKQMLDEKVQLFHYLISIITNLPFFTLRAHETSLLYERAQTLCTSMMENFLLRVKTDLKPFENSAMVGNCSGIEFEVWNTPPQKNIFDPSNFIALEYKRNSSGDDLDLDECLLLYNHYVLTYDLDTHFGPRQNMRWSSQLFFDCAPGAAVGKDIAMSLMCGDPSVGKGHNMKQVSRLYPTGMLKTPTNLSMAYYNNNGNTRGYVIFFDELKKHFMDSKVDTTFLNHIKNIGSNGYTSSNQQITNASTGKESIAYPYLSGPTQVSGNFSEEFIYKSDDAYFSRVLSQSTGIRPRADAFRKSGNISNIRIYQFIYPIYARFRELQFMGFFDQRKALNTSVKSILKRFFSFVSEHPHYSVYNRTQDQVEMRYIALVTRFAVMKVMCTTWGYNEFHYLGLKEPNLEIFRAINDQIQPSEKIMIFVISLYVETFFSNDSFVIEKELRESYKLYLDDSKLVLKDVTYTTNTPSGVKITTDPFYVRLNITHEALFNRIKRKNKLGQISFMNGLRALEKKEKFTASVEFNSDVVIPKTRTCDGETLLGNSGMMKRDVSPYIFNRSTDDRILDIYISKDYLNRMVNENVENYFETFILPNIIPLDFSNSPILTYGGVYFNGNYHIEHLNYVSYVAKSRDPDSNKSLRNSDNTNCVVFEPLHDPIGVFEIENSNDAFALTHRDVAVPKMFNKSYPADAIVMDYTLARREYTAEELTFLVFKTSFFKHAANMNLDSASEISINFERIEYTYKQQMVVIPESDRKMLKEGITLYRELKTQIDDNALLYFHATNIIKKMMGTQKDESHWGEFVKLWNEFAEIVSEIDAFDFAEVASTFKDVDADISEIKTRLKKQSLYMQLFVKFPFDEMYRNSNCPNKFVKDNVLYAMFFQFKEGIYNKYKDNEEFVDMLSVHMDGVQLPSIVNQFYEEFEVPI